MEGDPRPATANIHLRPISRAAEIWWFAVEGDIQKQLVFLTTAEELNARRDGLGSPATSPRVVFGMAFDRGYKGQLLPAW